MPVYLPDLRGIGLDVDGEVSLTSVHIYFGNLLGGPKALDKGHFGQMMLRYPTLAAALELTKEDTRLPSIVLKGLALKQYILFFVNFPPNL